MDERRGKSDETNELKRKEGKKQKAEGRRQKAESREQKEKGKKIERRRRNADASKYIIYQITTAYCLVLTAYR